MRSISRRFWEAHSEIGLALSAASSSTKRYRDPDSAATNTAFRDRRRYAENSEAQRERSRSYYRRNRDQVLEKAAAKRGVPRPPEHTHCTECGDELTGRRRVICGKARCRDRRFKRTNPKAYAERERQKVERRREKRRAKRVQVADEGEW